MPGTTSTPKKAPVRMGKLFSRMLTECPLDVRLHLPSIYPHYKFLWLIATQTDQFSLSCRQIQVYGKCVAEIHGGVNRQACEKEFQKLRACLDRVAHQRRV
ncbi:hypothetical protein P3T76_005298 [Phytophthora citrophthora]|uniref:Uncharacterized protein n=1 Tax=Phytophthora citrophthora TaxID=4793 RepID=A0AAD9GSK2_9STRA|nr:hypothetical protein P3T76_005298 [Phytophthora citrophthora]